LGQKPCRRMNARQQRVAELSNTYH
jgi:hypothetical protein